MKCWKCGLELDGNTGFCPHCAAGLERPVPKSREGKAMRQIYDDFGKNAVLSESSYLTAGLGDILSESENLRKHIDLAFHFGIGRMYLKQIEDESKCSLVFQNSIRNKLCDEAGLNDKVADNLIRFFNEMIGWPIEHEQTDAMADKTAFIFDNAITAPTGIASIPSILVNENEEDAKKNTENKRQKTNNLNSQKIRNNFSEISGQVSSVAETDGTSSGKTKSKTKKKTRIIVGIVCAIVFLSLVGAGVWYFLSKQSKEYTVPDISMDDVVAVEHYIPTIEHYYTSLLNRKPTDEEVYSATQSMHKNHGRAEEWLKEMVKSDEFTNRKLSTEDTANVIIKACMWGWYVEPQVEKELINCLETKSLDAFMDMLFETSSWRLSNPEYVIQVNTDETAQDKTKQVFHTGEMIVCWAELTNPSESVIETRVQLIQNGQDFSSGDFWGGKDAWFSKPVRFAGGNWTIVFKSDTLPTGVYRIVLRDPSYGTIWYEYDFEVK